MASQVDIATEQVLAAKARREHEQRIWDARQKFEALPPSRQASGGRIAWAVVAEELERIRETSPGAWLRIHSNARTLSAAYRMTGRAVPELEHLELDVFHRPAPPDHEGFEIYARISP